jgi:signal transduction histidine kinase/CheY-like chemotaxis protein
VRLADFISTNIEPILGEWEAFARSVWPSTASGKMADPAELRDHAGQILRAAVRDMGSDQTSAQQSDKSQGNGEGSKESDRVDRASVSHGAGRSESGFDLGEVIAEYRALRASVLRLWRESGHTPDLRDVQDITRFNECIDQSLAEGVRSFMLEIDRERQALLANEQAARAHAENANRAKDLFLATFSHELRTPLTAIKGWINLLRAGGGDESELNEGLEVIDRNTHSLAHLIDDVLDMSRIISGKLRVEMRPCDLVAAVHAGIDSVRPLAEARHITLDVELDSSVSRFPCDAMRMQQVVWNLVSNAVKFTPAGGRIGVTLWRQNSSLQLEVKDSGEGISSEFLPHVFDRFRQADSSTRRKFGGLGLGLSIVRSLVEGHGGTITASSDGEGTGATFTVLLPLLPAQTGEDAAAARAGTKTVNDEPVPQVGVEATRVAREGAGVAEEGGAGAVLAPMVRLDGVRVLIVEDEPDTRRLVVKMLKQAGAITTSAGGAAEALTMLAKDKPQVLVSDLGMADQDGFDLIRQVRSSGRPAKDLPAIALTAFVHLEDQEQALSAGFQVHIPKPVNALNLTTTIARLAGHPA